MVHIKSFKALRPVEKYVRDVAALPYDVVSGKEAREETVREPYSFLAVDRPETQFEEGTDAAPEETRRRRALPGLRRRRAL